MKQQLVFTVITQDKPGVITQLSDVVNQHGGNWLDSRMSQLAGEFAGIVHVEIDLDKQKDLETALTNLADHGITITVRRANTELAEIDYRAHEIEIIGNDRPGIVAEVSKLFSEKGINILEFDTLVTEASMSGGDLFHADAIIAVAVGTDLDELHDKLHDLADELALDIEWTSRL